MRRFLFIAVLLMFFNAVYSETCLEEVKTFYKGYMMNFLDVDSDNDSLCEMFLTEGMIAKARRMRYATGGDPIIRAQDVNEDAIKTLAVRRAADDWYLVSYLWNEKDSTTLTEIPLKAQSIDGMCKIVYITPIANGSQLGDERLSCSECMSVSKIIDEVSGKSFIESFYKAYLASYCAMSKDTDAKLSFLRSDNLSSTALQQFKKAETENQEDGLYGYDLLIDNFDFDCMWYESLKFIQLDDNIYQITYQSGTKVYTINIKIECRNGKYLINSISLV